MTALVVSPVVPPAVADARQAGQVNGRRALPVAQLAPVAGRSPVCGMAAIDCNGRITESTVIPALGWAPGTCVDIRVCGGLVLVTADPHAVFRVTQPGQVRLPAAVRQWYGLTSGSRVLLVADPAAGRLVVHPPAALHTMITEFHAAVLGGEAA
ncbi:AbrB/MazE/SpoVT family DNA-binding domain-containing protein [Phytohabitans kaempferiae]|uniref:AbrB/MazE/SpoVT family DNA-binding domain-containing protein n=1 Tax=Phytohabitans kaempferiae TaxID=1620943 RepID=A0ABV6LUG9_9ACTN